MVANIIQFCCYFALAFAVHCIILFVFACLFTNCLYHSFNFLTVFAAQAIALGGAHGVLDDIELSYDETDGNTSFLENV